MATVVPPARNTLLRQLRILLADDHTIVRQGLRRVLEEQTHWRVVAEAGDGRDAVRLAEEHKPDVAIIDVAMPLLNGIETTRQIVRRVPGVRVLVLSMYADAAYVTQMLDAGAGGYLLKDSADVDLFEAVSAVADGRTAMSPRRRMRFLTRRSSGPILLSLAAAAAAIAVPVSASASTQASPVVGHVYVNDNSAGTNTPDRSLRDLSDPTWQRVLGVNLNGAYHCVQAFLPTMRQQRDRYRPSPRSMTSGVRAMMLSSVRMNVRRCSISAQ